MTEQEPQPRQDDVPHWKIVEYGRFYASLAIVRVLRQMIDRRKGRIREQGEKSILSKAVDIVRFPKKRK